MKIMNKSNKESGSMPVITVIILFIITVVLLVIWGVKNETEYVETKYSLSELNDGVYAVYYTTHSAAPAFPTVSVRPGILLHSMGTPQPAYS